MSQIIDRRLDSKNKSVVNRQRFIRRYKKQIQKAVAESANKRSITQIDRGEKIKISNKDLTEPAFTFGKGGAVKITLPGNTEFVAGDHIKRPSASAQDGQKSASDSGIGDDDFVFEISREEFIDLYFDDLALPDLVKKQLAQIPDQKYVRAGISTTGIPANINIIRSMRQATARRIALGTPQQKKLAKLQDALTELLLKTQPDDPTVKKLKHEIALLEKKIAKIAFIDNIDLRFNYRVKQIKPTNQAVMFCIMDVSGSMDTIKKDIAKRFFIILYLFLNRNYETIKIVFIRHHTNAKEVNEEEFFYSKETGGTVVSSALELMHKIIQQNFSGNMWNIYAAQASDGDNWNADSPHCKELITTKILPYLQYYAYVEIMPRRHQSLWEAYASIQQNHPNFVMQTIQDVQDIYPVFRDIFKRKQA